METEMPVHFSQELFIVWTARNAKTLKADRIATDGTDFTDFTELRMGIFRGEHKEAESRWNWTEGRAAKMPPATAGKMPATTKMLLPGHIEIGTCP